VPRWLAGAPWPASGPILWTPGGTGAASDRGLLERRTRRPAPHGSRPVCLRSSRGAERGAERGAACARAGGV